jgi:DNA-binding transcriptional MerR regulator
MVPQGYYGKTVAAAVLGTTTKTLDSWVKKGVLVPHRCGREIMFPCEEINDLKRPKRIVVADTSLKAIAEALVADDPGPAPTMHAAAPAPVFNERGLETLGRLPKNREQVFRLINGERQLVRERYIEPSTTTEKDKPAEKEEEKESK